MLRYIQIYEASDENDRENYFKEVSESLDGEKKFIDAKFSYDKEGSEYYSNVNFQKDYYVSECEKQIFREQGSNILATIGRQKFNLVELGAGDALKTRILIETAVKQNYEFQYIPIDISHASNLLLAQNIRNISDQLDMTILTADYIDGVQWVFKNKTQRNVISKVKD